MVAYGFQEQVEWQPVVAIMHPQHHRQVRVNESRTVEASGTRHESRDVREAPPPLILPNLRPIIAVDLAKMSNQEENRDAKIPLDVQHQRRWAEEI